MEKKKWKDIEKEIKLWKAVPGEKKFAKIKIYEIQMNLFEIKFPVKIIIMLELNAIELSKSQIKKR